MAFRTWQVSKIKYCDHIGHEIASGIRCCLSSRATSRPASATDRPSLLQRHGLQPVR